MSAIKKADIERVENATKDRAFYENAILEAVREYYYTEYGVENTEDISKLPQNSFVSACDYARRLHIKRDDLLTIKEHQINRRSGGVAYNEMYDADTVDLLCSVYVSICFKYDRVPSIYGFSVLSGIDRATLEQWVKEVTSSHRRDTIKKAVKNIKAARVQSLQNIAASGGKGVVGSLAILNNEFWNEKQVEEEQPHIPQVWELPDLSDLRHSPIEKELPTIEMPQFDENGEFIGMKLV